MTVWYSSATLTLTLALTPSLSLTLPLSLHSNKRLGASRGTMFVIGGVTALKQHAFFEDLDWTDLINLEIEPPIDLSKPYVLANSNNNSSSNNNNGNGNGNINPNTPGISNAKKGDINSPAVTSINMNMNMNKEKEKESDREGRSCPVTPRTPLNTDSSSVQTLPLTMEHLTRHFHEGFTGQQVSLSDVEESYSTSTISRAGALSLSLPSFVILYSLFSIYTYLFIIFSFLCSFFFLSLFYFFLFFYSFT